MSEPEEVQFACVGCGAKNPVGAEVCSKCGHRFAGPGGGPVPESDPAPAFVEARLKDDEPHKPARPSSGKSTLGILSRAIGWIVAGIASPIAFVVAFYVTCSATNGASESLVWSFMAGLAAAGLVVAFSVWVASIMRRR